MGLKTTREKNLRITDRRERNGKSNQVQLSKLGLGRTERTQERKVRDEGNTYLGPVSSWTSYSKCPTLTPAPSSNPVPQFQSGTEGHLEAITGIIYNHSEVTTQKCRLQGREREKERGLFPGFDTKRENSREKRKRPGDGLYFYLTVTGPLEGANL